MANTNIQIGIDLGTTNSEIAINNNDTVEIVKNIWGDEYTPSVFGIDKAKNKVVGKRAYKRLYKEVSEEEFRNHKAEVKRIMGTSETTHFDRLDLEMNPEEISAEILKSLKEDVLRKYPNFNTIAAVISVPAAFTTVQSEATKRAGNLAGFEHVVLLQEPIAAAVAYGFGSNKNENWLVYDLGGGTFDVALISSRDGVLSVLGHNGDNFLGGKNIDLEIVDKIIVPRIINKFSLTNFSRNNEKYRAVFAKLKYIAEMTKLELSQYKNSTVEIEGIGKDNDDKEIYLSTEFSRKEFEELIKPLVDRTIDLSKQTLKETGTKNTKVKKIILVGGPTQIPFIKERLENELKIPVDTSIDPLTIVARGSCIFAIGQRLPKNIVKSMTKNMKTGTLTLDLHYEALTSEVDKLITGTIGGLGNKSKGCYVQIQSESNTYSGPKVKLDNGKFKDNIVVEPDKSTLYWIYLFDKNGNRLSIVPDSFTITHGLSVSGAPLPHSIGIVLVQKDLKNNFISGNVREIIFEKGSSLPLKHLGTYKTARELKKGDMDNPLNISIDEGESDIPNRNFFACELGISGKELPYDLPEGTEIEITFDINVSRELFVSVYIPLLDQTINGRSTIKDEIIDITKLEAELSVQTDKAKNISGDCTPKEQEKVEGMIQSVRESVENAHLDEDEKRKASTQIKTLKIALDEIEKEKEMPQLVKQFRSEIEKLNEIIDEYADEKDKEENTDQMSKMKDEGEKAIRDNDKIILSRVNEQIQELQAKAVFSNPATWVYQFNKLVSKGHNYSNDKEARYYTEKGHKAIEVGDMDELKRCVRNLMLLLPLEQQEELEKNLSGITST